MKKYVIEKYSAEIPAKDFKYEKGMLLNIEKDNMFEEIKSFDNRDLALNELKNYKNNYWYSSYSVPFYNVEEYVVTEYEYDKNKDREYGEEYNYISVIEIANLDPDRVQEVYRNNIYRNGEIVDYEINQENNNEIRPLYKVNNEFYLPDGYIKFTNIDDFDKQLYNNKIEYLNDVIDIDDFKFNNFTEFEENPLKKNELQVNKFINKIEDVVERFDLTYSNGEIYEEDNIIYWYAEAPNNTTILVDFTENEIKNLENEDQIYKLIYDNYTKSVLSFDINNEFQELWSNSFAEHNNFTASEFLNILREDKEYFESVQKEMLNEIKKDNKNIVRHDNIEILER